jgi:bifunctional non-homologous end joining protein LigD
MRLRVGSLCACHHLVPPAGTAGSRPASPPAPTRCRPAPAGVAIFDALHRRGTVSEAMLAFDLLELYGEDVRGLPSGDRKKRMARLLAGRRVGIVLSERTADDGATIFRQACRMNLEGIVSKRLSAPYRSGRSRDWLKVKNPDSPAMVRAREAEW